MFFQVLLVFFFTKDRERERERNEKEKKIQKKEKNYKNKKRKENRGKKEGDMCGSFEGVLLEVHNSCIISFYGPKMHLDILSIHHDHSLFYLLHYPISTSISLLGRDYLR